jgi:predicted enzyme involved in methoxymalonyl-ACP biosynthesis
VALYDMVQKIKCVIWDLDNTIWDGVLSEDKEVKLNDNIKEIIEELDK